MASSSLNPFRVSNQEQHKESDKENKKLYEEWVSIPSIYHDQKYFDRGVIICDRLKNIITFCISDQMGNGLFLYFAAKVIAKEYNLHYFDYDTCSRILFPTTEDNNKRFELMKMSMSIIGDCAYKNDTARRILKNSLAKEINSEEVEKLFLPQTNILLYDWCQVDSLLLNPYIHQLFTENNTDIFKDRILGRTTIGEIFKGIHKYKYDYEPSDIVLHLRLGDFNHGQLIEAKWFIQLLNTLDMKDKKLHIVVATPTKAYEIEYLKNFNDFKPIIHSGTLLEDIAMIYFAPNLICNTSTFSWIFGALGKCKRSWVPRNTKPPVIPSIYNVDLPLDHLHHNYMFHQDVKKIKPNTENFDVEFQKVIY